MSDAGEKDKNGGAAAEAPNPFLPSPDDMQHLSLIHI